MAKPSSEEIQKFSSMIEGMALEMGCNRLDAILHHCENTGLEVEVASTLISNVLKSKIREESEKDNLVKRTSKLPI
jgi:hypothetical protein